MASDKRRVHRRTRSGLRRFLPTLSILSVCMTNTGVLGFPGPNDGTNSMVTLGSVDSFRLFQTQPPALEGSPPFPTSANAISTAIVERLTTQAGGGPQVVFRDMGDDPALGREILKTEEPKVDLVVAVGAEAAVLAQELVSTHPVLFCGVSNPTRYALAPPKVAGVTREPSTEFQLKALRQLLPGRPRVGIIFQPDRSTAFVQSAIALAPDLGLVVVPAAVRSREEIDPVFRMIRRDIDVLWLVPDSLVDTDLGFEYVATRAMEYRIPIAAFAESFARRGALLAMYSTPQDVGEECGALAASLLRKETTPEEIAIRGPQKVRLKVNRYIADTLGIPVPPAKRGESRPGGL